MATKPPKPYLPSASERTVNLFAAPVEPVPEYLEGDAKDRTENRTESSDRLRDNAFQVQEWTSKSFGITPGPANEYRVTLRKGFYYLECVSDARYCGLMIPETDLFNITGVIVDAAKAKRARE